MTPEAMRHMQRESQQETHTVGTPGWWKDQSETHLPNAPEWFHSYVATGGGLLIDALAVAGIFEGALAIGSKINGPIGTEAAKTTVFKNVNKAIGHFAADHSIHPVGKLAKNIEEGIKSKLPKVDIKIVMPLKVKPA